KRWQEHRVLGSDVDAIARPQLHSVVALLSDEAEAIPLAADRSGAVLIKINQMARAATMKNLCAGIGLFTAVWLFSG
ncbi:MAG TPA: hypothetical protein VG425_13410, partial [Casimicrobiaceae bacterium]|nr:hypothetical protein [Casimicrobiaceae bacterium]